MELIINNHLQKTITDEQLNNLINERANELRELLKYRRSVCNHEFMHRPSLYYDPSDYDCQGSGYICKKCRFTKKCDSEKFSKLPLYCFRHRSYGVIPTEMDYFVYVDDYVIRM